MAPEQRRTRVRRLALGAAVAVVSATLACGPAVGVEVVRATDPRPPAPSPVVPEVTVPAVPEVPGATVPPVPQAPAVTVPAVPPVPVITPSVPTPPAVVRPPMAMPAPVAQLPAFGAFLSSDAGGVARLPQLSHWLGGADLRVGHTYLPGDSWADIEGAPGFLQAWARWRGERPDRMLVLNVPLQEHNEAGVPDAEVARLLRQGAAGAFDHHFRVLAERLVRLGVPDTVLVLGWEMNGATYTHRCGPDPEAWKKYWNRIVTAMRSVPGQRFRFDFTPSRGLDAVPWTQCYPGDDTVDIVGMDSYDQPAGISFEQQVNEPFGLRAHVEFAKAHGKPFSYPEWGLFRNGDNAEYMRHMLAWMDEHRPLYNTLSDYCPHGVWQCPANPRASHVYRSFLFGRADRPAPVPTTTPTPAPRPDTPGTPPPPANCTTLNLGSWVEHWLGGRLCVRFDGWS
ncbi:glycosyl hydrolase [Streptomyces sp. NPDC015220]|uniref:glycosyl hydrolase n=1 Tax=Streptomyces sp. NPDC015220 TaxID=3364947 RepID=UPI0036FEF344